MTSNCVTIPLIVLCCDQGAKDGVSHEGWLGVEGPPGADWERRFGRICMRETGAVLQLGLDEQRRVRPQTTHLRQHAQH